MNATSWNVIKRIGRIILLSLCCLVWSESTLAQTIEEDYSIVITGAIVGLSESVSEYRVTVSTSRADSVPSVLLFSNAFCKSHFNFKIQNVGTPLTLSVNAVGYRSVHKDLGIVVGKRDIGTLELVSDTTLQLTTVVVTAQRPLVVEHGMKSVYNISGSMLSEAGTLKSLLRRLPNLSVDNGKIAVLDSYGIETVVLLNDRELRDENILEVLNAKDVKNIEIDRNPEIIYQGKIVIKIETVKK